jgi:hypothetical protein
MPVSLTDTEIQHLLAEPKRLPEDFRNRVVPKLKRGHKEQELDLRGQSGSEFRLIVRQNSFNVLDFTAILAYRPPRSNKLFRLRRCNGRHVHTNKLEGNAFDGFHIHMATERYQQAGFEKEDAYAEPTDRYSDLAGATECLLRDCSFVFPTSGQGDLFEEGSFDER